MSSRNSTQWCSVEERIERRLVEKAEYVGEAVMLLARIAAQAIEVTRFVVKYRPSDQFLMV